MKRDLPPEFPVDTRLMPQARDRVRLAVRLDEMERRQKKAKTDLDWAKRTADELDIELDEDVAASLGAADEEEAPAEERRMKKRKKIGGKVGKPRVSLPQCDACDVLRRLPS
jgi:hypothetical protein